MALRPALICFLEHILMYGDSAPTHLCNSYTNFYYRCLNRKYGMRIIYFNIPASALGLQTALVHHLGQWKRKVEYGTRGLWNILRVRREGVSLLIVTRVIGTLLERVGFANSEQYI